MWLAELDSRQNLQVRELAAAPIDTLEIAVDVEYWRGQISAIIDVLARLAGGKSSGPARQASSKSKCSEKTRAGNPIRTARSQEHHGPSGVGFRTPGVPGPLAMNMAIGRKFSQASLPSSTSEYAGPLHSRIRNETVVVGTARGRNTDRMTAIPGSSDEPWAFRIVGEGLPSTICLAASPLRATSYLGELGGMASKLPMAIPEMPTRRVDLLVAEVEALREHLGLDRFDLLAHSAGASLAIHYAVVHPRRIRRLVLITPSTRAVAIQPENSEVADAIHRRSEESWFPAALAALGAREGGDQSPSTALAAAPFYYGRWDARAQQHAKAEPDETRPAAWDVFYADGAPAPDSVRNALSDVNANVQVIAGGLDIAPTARMARDLAALFPHAEVATQPDAGHYPWLDDPVTFVRIAPHSFHNDDTDRLEARARRIRRSAR